MQGHGPRTGHGYNRSVYLFFLGITYTRLFAVVSLAVFFRKHVFILKLLLVCTRAVWSVFTTQNDLLGSNRGQTASRSHISVLVWMWQRSAVVHSDSGTGLTADVRQILVFQDI